MTGSPTTRRSCLGGRRAGLIGVLGALALAGCGGQSDQAAIRSAMARLERATAAKDYRTLCRDVLAPSLLVAVNRLGLACEQALARGLGSVQDPRLVVRSVKVKGSTALVTVHSSAANQQPSDDTVALVKIKGQWRVSSLVSPGGAAASP